MSQHERLIFCHYSRILFYISRLILPASNCMIRCVIKTKRENKILVSLKTFSIVRKSETGILLGASSY